MTYLSSNQLKQYEDEGFVSPINIFSKDLNINSKGSTIIDFTCSPYNVLRQGDGVL